MIKDKFMIWAGMLAIVIALVIPSQAEDPFGNGVLVGGNSWGAYRPPHLNNGQYTYVGALNNNLQTRGDGVTYGNFIFYQGRHQSSPRFANPGFSWPAGKYIGNAFNGKMSATIFDTSAAFAAANSKNYETAPADNRELQHSFLKYDEDLPGAGDPNRDYVKPGGKGLDGGGVIWLGDKKGMQLYEAGWPTNVGIDVKMKVYAFTTTWGNLDDFHFIEIEYHNTGEADIDGDGTADISGNKIHSLAMNHGPTGNAWRMTMVPSGDRHYATSNYRGVVHDATPDENGAPWNYVSHMTGARDRSTQLLPSVGNRHQTNWIYMDANHGFTWLGAKKVDATGLIAGEKNLSFAAAVTNEETVPAVGTGTQRGWFMSNTTTEARISDTAFGYHMNAIGQFFTDGGKSRSNSGDVLDFTPNAAIFASGTPGDVTTFVPKDPSAWSYPDGAFELAAPTATFEGITLPGENPIASPGGQPTNADQLHAGFTVMPAFNMNHTSAMGPFKLGVGEKMRAYFVQGFGFRPKGIRAALKGARAVYDGIKDGTDGTPVDPGAPAVPDIKIAGTAQVKPVIMFNTVDDADGYKIYRSTAWPAYKPWEDGLPFESVYWKTMTPGKTNRPEADPYNPMLDITDSRLKESPGEYWGPYTLLKTISNTELTAYANSNAAEVDSYPYAYEDKEDAFTLPGQTFWYYVAAYKNGGPAAEYAHLEDTGINWIESGKVNINGRSGEWTGAWPNTPTSPGYPEASDQAGQKEIGAPFVNISKPVDAAALALNRLSVIVRPNPYKRVAFHDVGAEHKIMFANLPSRATITILDISGQIIDKIDYESPTTEDGTYFWNMFSKDGTEVANGMYIWIVEHERGMEKGMLAILRN